MALDATMAAMTAMKTRGETVEAYDQMIAEGNAAGQRDRAGHAVDGLVAQTASIEQAIEALGLGQIQLERSQALDNPAAVFQCQDSGCLSVGPSPFALCRPRPAPAPRAGTPAPCRHDGTPAMRRHLLTLRAFSAGIVAVAIASGRDPARRRGIRRRRPRPDLGIYRADHRLHRGRELRGQSLAGATTTQRLDRDAFSPAGREPRLRQARRFLGG